MRLSRQITLIATDGRVLGVTYAHTERPAWTGRMWLTTDPITLSEPVARIDVTVPGAKAVRLIVERQEPRAGSRRVFHLFVKPQDLDTRGTFQ